MSLKIETLKIILPQEELDALMKKVPKGQTPIWVHWAEFVERYVGFGRSILTVKSVRDALKMLLRHTNLITFEDFNDPNRIEKELKALNKSKSTYNTYRKNILTYFIWLERKELIKENKMRKIDRYKEPCPDLKGHTEEEISKIWRVTCETGKTPLERARNRVFVTLLIITGARPCELLDLKDSDFLKGKGIRINGRKQKGKSRPFPLPANVIDEIENYLHQKRKYQRYNEENLFVSLSKKTGWTEKGLRHFLRSVSKKVGFRVNCYGFRRYVATKLFTISGNIKDVMVHFGHTRATTSYRYIQNLSSFRQKGVDIMSGTFDTISKKKPKRPKKKD